MDDATNPCGGFQLQDSQPHCGHACEPNALASGITRIPPNLATPTSKPNQSPTLARSAHSEVLCGSLFTRSPRGRLFLRKCLNHVQI